MSRLFDASRFALSGLLCAGAMLLYSCSGEESVVQQPDVDVSELFVGADDADVDFDKKTIVLPEKTESLKFDNLAVLGGEKCYLALDDDPIDPEIDWDSPVKTGKDIDIGDEGLSIVVLDDESRVVAVWRIEQPAEKSSSSKAKSSSSSSKAKSSSSSEKASSSSKEKSSSSSSSDVILSGDSREESSSSSSSGAILSGDSREESSSSSSSDVILSGDSHEESSSSSSNENTESSSSSSAESSSSIVEVQLPGSDFSARNDFWATTSDAMATKKTASLITISSQANLSFDGGAATVSTQEVEGSLLLDGSWKMAGGFYFSGSYAGENALDIYQQGYTSGTPSTDCSDISKDMTFGKSFTARPTAFTVKYSYTHVANKSSEYPQKSLVYVMLVGKGGKVVATGAFSDDASVDMKTRTVKLSYGKDPFGLLSGEYPVAEGLSLGKGDEDVTSIHVMFASSAYAHIVCGGTAGNSGKYRGGAGSALVLDDFKLEYLEE